MAQFNISKTFDTEKFIRCVRLRPVIWDQTSEEYSNKVKKQDAWLEVCREMYDSFDDFEVEKKNEIGKRVLKKWKNLRNCFAREVRKRKIYNSSSDHKKYIFYDNLSFLEVNLQNSTVSNVDDDDEDTTLQSVNQEKLLDKKKIPKRPKKDHFLDVKSLGNEVQHKNVDSSKSKLKEHSSDDPDRLFMLSLVKELHEIPPERKFQAKCELMAVLSKHKNFSHAFPPQNLYYPTNFPYFPQQFQYSEPLPSQQPKKRPFSPWTTSDDSSSASSDIDFGS